MLTNALLVCLLLLTGSTQASPCPFLVPASTTTPYFLGGDFVNVGFSVSAGSAMPCQLQLCINSVYKGTIYVETTNTGSSCHTCIDDFHASGNCLGVCGVHNQVWECVEGYWQMNGPADIIGYADCGCYPGYTSCLSAGGLISLDNGYKSNIPCTQSPTTSPTPPSAYPSMSPETTFPSNSPRLSTIRPTSTYRPSSALQQTWEPPTSPVSAIYLPLIAGLSAIGLIGFIALSAVFVVRRLKGRSAMPAPKSTPDALVIDTEVPSEQDVVGSIPIAESITATTFKQS